MILFFSAARVVLFGRTLKHLEAGHAVIMRQAFDHFGNHFPADIDQDLVILSNQRTDMPAKRADGTISLWGLAVALLWAQTLPKYHHGMRQPWHHPTKNLPKVQLALHQRLLRAVTATDPTQTAVLLGGALHTLQDTYTIGHTEREDNGDPFSPLVRLHYSPSRIHPLISPDDRVWADASQTALTPPAQAALHATIAALELWIQLWRTPAAATAAPQVAEFIQRFAPIRGSVFEPVGKRKF